MRKEMHQPKPKGSQSGRSIDDDELMVAGGRHKEDPPAVPRPQELREGMQVTQIRGSLREKVFNYVTSTDAGRAGLSDKVRILGQTVRYQRDLEELQELLDYKAFPIPLFDEKSPTYTNTKTRVWGDGLEDSPINRPLIAFQVAKSKFHGYSRLIAERKREEVEQMQTTKTRGISNGDVCGDVKQWDKCTDTQKWKKLHQLQPVPF